MPIVKRLCRKRNEIAAARRLRWTRHGKRENLSPMHGQTPDHGVHHGADPAAPGASARGGLTVHPPLAEGTEAGDWVARAAEALLSHPVDWAVERILSFVGPETGADRAWALEYSADGTMFRNTHEWCRQGVTSHVGDLQNVPVTLIGGMQAHLEADEAVLVHAVGAMPRSMHSMQAEFRRQGIVQTVTVPVHRNGRLRGAIGLDRTRPGPVWSADTVRALRRVGALIWRARAAGDAHRAAQPDAAAPGFANRLYLHTARSVLAVSVCDILLLRADRDWTHVHLAGGNEVVDRRPLKWWQSVLPGDQFFRLHRSAMVQVPCISALERLASRALMARVAGLDEPVRVARGAEAELRSRLGF